MQRLIFCLLIMVLAGIPARGQSYSITGVVVDQNDLPVPGLGLQFYRNRKVYAGVTTTRGIFWLNGITSVKDGTVPSGYSVSDNFPNPFNPTTRFMIATPATASAHAVVYNILGQKILSTDRRTLFAGINAFDLELNGHPNGMYMVCITIDDKFTVVKRIMLLYGSPHLHAGSVTTLTSSSILGKTASEASVNSLNFDSVVVSITSKSDTTLRNLTASGTTDFNLGTLKVTVPPMVAPMVDVGPGSFLMNGTTVTMSGFKIDTYEVIYGLWMEVEKWGHTHGYTDLPDARSVYSIQGLDAPVTEMEWYNAVKWCNARSEKEGLTPVYHTLSPLTSANVYRTDMVSMDSTAVDWNANGYRLPTEAEWEFAARGGTKSHGYLYSGSDLFNAVAWSSANSGGMITHTVGMLMPNELGIYDLSGNVWEFCWDFYTSAYPAGGTKDPKGPGPTQYRVLRGGSAMNDQSYCLVTYHNWCSPSNWATNVGFRCVRNR